MIRSLVCIFVFISFVVDSKRCFHFCFFYLDLRKSTLQSDEVAAEQSSTQACPARMAFLSVKHRQKGVLPPVSTMQLLQKKIPSREQVRIPPLERENHHHCHLTGYATMLGGAKLSYILQKSMIDENFGQDLCDIERHKPEG